MENQNIAELIDRVTTGDPWHGSNVTQLLTGLSAAAAARPPSAGVHSIWEIVLHMTGWTNEVRKRLRGRAAQDPDGGDWPAVGEISEEQWAAAKDALFAAHRALAQDVRGLNANLLDEPVLDYRDRALGVGLSKYLTLHGLVHHTIYHSGQIGLLRKLVT
jgi:hypothetical protein